MNKLKKILVPLVPAILSALLVKNSAAQDPSFSQFFSSPLNINPALTANINADWRAIANFRDQWIGPASPYVTGTLSYDRKFQKKIPNVEFDGNSFGAGTMMMYDRAMGGVVKSTYMSLNISYRVKLTDGKYKHRLGAGFGSIYGHRRIDFTGIDFEEQFTGYGFNTNLPTGETSLSSMKPYFSVSTGLLYSITSENSNFDLGVSAFHVNKPKQTFLKDENQYLPMRKVVHSNFETLLSESLVLNLNAVYQSQSTAEYYSFGGALGYYLPYYNDLMLNAGIWYWSKNAVIPYVGLAYKDYQFGLSYDVTVSKLRQANDKPNTYELSLIVRGRNKPSFVIPCPWK
jgi:type IX secretion system PorP/SprF family membrane protein